MTTKKALIVGFVSIFSLIFLAGMFTGGSSDSESQSSPQSQSSQENKLGSEIVFFWLPSGDPCQQQDKILKELEAENTSLKVTRVDVTDSRNSSLANKFGIRSVPAIVVLSEDGNTVKQFTPGIQPESTLKKYLI
jgi:thioredoxin-like negative regulator of GroEL